MPVQPICTGAFSPVSDYLWVTWSLLTTCNYNCSYCKVYSPAGVPNPEVIEKVVTFLKHIPHKHKEVTLFGGEPTLVANVVELTERLSQFCKVHVFTNASLPSILREIQNYASLSITYHPDIISPDSFLNSLADIKKEQIDFINVMMYRPRWEWYVNPVAEYCRNNQLVHRLIPIWGMSDLSDWFVSAHYSRRKDVLATRNIHVVYSEEHRNIFSDQECTAYGISKFKGYKCYAGSNSLFIDHTGKVYKCQADVREGKILFDVENGDFYPSEKMPPYTCPREECTCEYYIPKELEEGMCAQFLPKV